MVEARFESIADTVTEINPPNQYVHFPIFQNQFLLKISPSPNFHTYLGLRSSVDGLTTIFGIKLAGIKILVPWMQMHRAIVPSDQETDNDTVLASRYIKHAIVIISCLTASYLLQRHSLKKREKELEEWYKEGIKVHWRRHMACLHMIQASAIKN